MACTTCITTCLGFCIGTTALAWQPRWRCASRFLKMRCLISPSICQGGPNCIVGTQAAAELLPADVVYARKKGFLVTSKFSRGTQRLLLGGRLAEVMEWSAEATDEIV